MQGVSPRPSSSPFAMQCQQAFHRRCTCTCPGQPVPKPKARAWSSVDCRTEETTASHHGVVSDTGWQHHQCRPRTLSAGSTTHMSFRLRGKSRHTCAPRASSTASPTHGQRQVDARLHHDMALVCQASSRILAARCLRALDGMLVGVCVGGP